jgi:DNA repair protein RecO (recombination protein O)
VLAPGNAVQADLRARTDTQLAQLSIELVHSRAPLFAEPLAAAGIDWVCALTAAALPEGQPYPSLHAGLDGLLGAIEAAPSARGWTAALVRYELLLLGQLGYGLDEERLLSLPPALRTGGPAEDAALRERLRISGAALARDVLVDRRADVLAARERLIARLGRMAA